MRIAKLHMDSQDKTRFEILGKSSVKYHLKANHVVEAKRWFWSLNNAIQWAKDEAKEEERRRTRTAEAFRQAKMEQVDGQPSDCVTDTPSIASSKANRKGLAPSSLGVPTSNGSRLSTQPSRTTVDSTTVDEDASIYAPSYDPSVTQNEMNIRRMSSQVTTIPDDVDDDYVDDASSRDIQPVDKDAFNITAQSAKLQLELLASVSASLQNQKSENPQMLISDPAVEQALVTYQAAVSSLNGLIQDLLKISRDRDAYWQYRLDKEEDTRKMWEESMARVAQEHEELQSRIGESEDKRRRTKKALREALGNASAATSRPVSRGRTEAQLPDVPETEHDTVDESLRQEVQEPAAVDGETVETAELLEKPVPSKTPTPVQIPDLSDSEDDEDEFFDAVDAGQIEAEPLAESEVKVEKPVPEGEGANLRVMKQAEISPSFRGYEDPIREKLKMEADNRPKISLWVCSCVIFMTVHFSHTSQGILKSMIGKDMTKMTLPVSFNEPTSLLQRVAEDMEYADLLDVAADRADSMERMLYVAAFAASEYASTIGRVAKPFNPLLGETYEYVRPDKGYRFFIEQVSHHPPIGAAWAESPKWDYYVSRYIYWLCSFYGNSDIVNSRVSLLLSQSSMASRSTSTPWVRGS